MRENYEESVQKIRLELERLLPLMLVDHEVAPEAYHTAQHARDWMELCRNSFNASKGDTRCPFCKTEFFLDQSPIACPACGHAVDNWIGDEELEEALDADLQRS